MRWQVLCGLAGRAWAFCLWVLIDRWVKQWTPSGESQLFDGWEVWPSSAGVFGWRVINLWQWRSRRWFCQLMLISDQFLIAHRCLLYLCKIIYLYYNIFFSVALWTVSLQLHYSWTTSTTITKLKHNKKESSDTIISLTCGGWKMRKRKKDFVSAVWTVLKLLLFKNKMQWHYFTFGTISPADSL